MDLGNFLAFAASVDSGNRPGMGDCVYVLSLEDSQPTGSHPSEILVPGLKSLNRYATFIPFFIKQNNKGDLLCGS